MPNSLVFKIILISTETSMYQEKKIVMHETYVQIHVQGKKGKLTKGTR